MLYIFMCQFIPHSVIFEHSEEGICFFKGFKSIFIQIDIIFTKVRFSVCIVKSNSSLYPVLCFLFFFDIDKDTYHPFCSTICPAACVGTDPEPLVSIIFRLKSVLYIVFFLICPVSYNIFQKINASFFILRMKKIRP